LKIPETLNKSPIDEMKNRKSEICVMVSNEEEGTTYFWDQEKFSNRLFMIRDLVDVYFENENEGGTTPVRQNHFKI
jgi:hypothetical protein